MLRLAHGDRVQTVMQNKGGPPAYQQGTAVQVHLPANALRVLKATAKGDGEAPPLIVAPMTASASPPPSP
jgi:hypothetical protein